MTTHSRRSRRRVHSLAVLAVAGLLVAACGNSGDKEGGDTTTPAPQTTSGDTTASTTGDTGSTTPDTTTADSFVPITGVDGVSDTEIAYSIIGVQSVNPLGTCMMECFNQGVTAYFNYINDQGGVHGRKLVVKKTIDDELAKQQEKALEVINAKDSFGVFAIGQIQSGFPDLDKAGVPTYTWVVGATDSSGLNSIYPTPGGNVCDGCLSQSPVYAAKMLGATKVAFLGYGISPASKNCADANAASMDKFGPGIGAKTVYKNNSLAFGLPNGIGPEVTAMVAAGVDLVITCMDLNGDKTVAQELRRQGSKAHMVHPNMYDSEFVKNAGGVFEGDLVTVSFRPFESDANYPTLKAFFDSMGAAGYPVSEMALYGWTSATMAVTGLRAAGPNFDRAKVIEASNQITDFTADGLIAPLDWTKQHTKATADDPVTNAPPQRCISYVKVVGDGFEFVGDPAKPFFCWAPDALDEYTEPTQMNFD